MVMPLSIATVAVLFGPRDRPRAVAAVTMAMGLGLPLGPVVGGLLLDHFNWSSVFWLNVPLIAIVIPAAAAWLPESTNPDSPPIDVLGAGLAVAYVVALVFAIVQAPSWGWTAPPTLAMFALAALMCAAFLVRERRGVRLVDPALFADRRFTWGTVAGVVTMFALFGILFTVPQFLQAVLGYDALGTGLRMVPLMAGLAAAAPLATAVDRRWGSRAPVAGGLLLLAGMLAATSRLTPETDGIVLGGLLAVGGFGIGLAMIPAMDAVIGAVPGGELGVGAAVNTTLRQLGGALGIALLGSLLSTVYTHQLDPALERLPTGAAALARRSIVGADAAATQLHGAGDALRAAAREAFTAGLGAVGLACAGVTVAGALLVWRFLPARVAA